ncbi:hypothetical protein FEQ05_03062 [Burkholderia pseudomultivorans]|uniref:Uncharacterized protein n=1 Tax=Burkholderia pseudomultivorans TaxID=1207504 RepID=A0A6P2NIP7_9BURK|nr:hypothetical protein [Burkholderia pseudomultivorans]MDR8737414.1 hypothetical protein [Burkholderia pseudomultivorans]MDR8743611.1 hypothetical protein [Burkholderia pseudomultivorans]MDR8755009.1 hypothetical protein [Burkholderia pseudomultivorans]MDR8780149.1 hypothetical protein [Burkholderia pseudomultivorans]
MFGEICTVALLCNLGAGTINSHGINGLSAYEYVIVTTTLNGDADDDVNAVLQESGDDGVNDESQFTADVDPPATCVATVAKFPQGVLPPLTAVHAVAAAAFNRSHGDDV